jgi:phage tail-like protein
MANPTGWNPNTPKSKADPLLTYMFSVEATVKVREQDAPGYTDAELSGYFTELSNLGDENDVVEFKAIDSSSGRDVTLFVPGRLNTNEITLKRGVTNDMTFWAWRQTVRDGEIDQARTNLTIVMYNRKYEPLVEWTLTAAWPSKLSGPDSQAGNSDFGVEEVTIYYHDLEYRQYTGNNEENES